MPNRRRPIQPNSGGHVRRGGGLAIFTENPLPPPVAGRDARTRHRLNIRKERVMLRHHHCRRRGHRVHRRMRMRFDTHM
ncbi:hypothetical protein Psi02_04580 [Planotetraspora silvatica]|uniref:Uncharacterized protein n=1 Tax=Planotetraspora silvatica TaxID=234614 RepID=A0A8J3UEF6_9ACTN|nr:hypothetical protein Psi02_04580 [Planotetraspora silvatica]